MPRDSRLVARQAALDRKYVWNRYDSDELYNLVEDRSEMSNLVDEKSYRDRIVECRRLIVEMLEPSGPGLYDWCLRDIGS